MSDHLPECPMLDERYPKHPLENCDYCTMLRACEQRVFQEQIKGRQHDMVMAYLRGLDAARDAVVRAFGPPRLHPNWQACGDRDHSCYLIADALAAIDALRGES